MNKSYIMIKPEGQRYLEEIDKAIVEFGFKIESVYYVEDWERICSQIYEKCLNEHDEIFREDFLGHVWLNKYMFGNEALVLILSKEGFFDSELLEEIMKLKKHIRNTYNATKNGTFMILMDLSRTGVIESKREKGKINLQQEGKNAKPLDEMLSQLGSFATFFLQYVHCPDAIVYDAINEMTILEKNNIFLDSNIVTKEEWALMKKHRTMKKR